MPRIWHNHFGFLAGHSGCVVIGEWGGFNDGNDGIWQRAFAEWLSERRVGSFYWALNPTSRDTGGLLLDDWRRPNVKKLELLWPMPATPVLPHTSVAIPMIESRPVRDETGVLGATGVRDSRSFHSIRTPGS